ALVEGDLAGAGTFDADLVRDSVDRRRGIARRGQEGKRAVTRYRVLERFGRATLVAIELETGRTHQIRVHFSAAGHPVIGDTVYGRRGQPAPPVPASRQMLHARRLGFLHPRTGERVHAEPPSPEDMKEALMQLRSKRKKPRETRGLKRS